MLLSTIFFILPGVTDAGPLNSFASSPIPYWDDDSSDVAPTWNSDDQTITFAWANTSEDSDYWEDCSVVNDWTPDPGNAPTTDGDIMYWEVVGNNGWFWIYSDEPVACSAGSTVKIKMRLNNSDETATIQPRLYTANAHLGDVQVLGSETPTDVWTVYTYTTTLITESFVFLGKDPSTDFTLEVDWIRIYNKIGELDLNIPINKQDSQQVSLYINSTELNSEVTLELYANTTTTGTSCTVNDTYVTFNDAGLIGTTVQTDGWSRITFNNYQEIAISEIIVADENMQSLDYWTNYYTFTGVNWLKLSDAAFNGSIQLLYVNGDTNYTIVWAQAEWVKSGTHDTQFDQYILGFNATEDGSALNHDVSYEATLPYLSFLRTEFVYWDMFAPGAAGVDGWSEWKITINIDDNWSVEYGMNHTMTIGVDDYYAFVTVYNNAGIKFGLMNELFTPLTYNKSSIGKLMFWRTQEDQIGLMVWGFDEYFNLFTGSYYWDNIASSWEYSAGQNETTWISDEQIEDWSNTTVTIHYYYEDEALNNILDVFFQFNYFEYGYWSDTGLVQPHFSSTWFMGWRVGPENNNPPVNWDIDSYVAPEPEPTLTPFEQGLQDMGNLFGIIGRDIAAWFSGGITLVANVAWTGMITAVTTGMNILAAVWEGAINFLWAGAGTAMINLFSGIVNTIGGLGSLVVTFFEILAVILVYVGYGLAWADTYLFTPDVALMIGGILIILPMMALSGNNFMGKGTGTSGALAWLVIYTGILMSILSLGWRLVMGIINTVANFIPFT